MKKIYLDRLGWLASARLQRRFIAQGTRDQYVLPEELLENAQALPVAILNELKVEGRLTEEGLSALRELSTVLQREDSRVPLDGSISREELIEKDPSWLKIRVAALRCVEALGIDLQSWEDTQ